MFAYIIILVNIQDACAAFKNIPLLGSLGTELFSLLAKVSLYVSTFHLLTLNSSSLKLRCSNAVQIHVFRVRNTVQRKCVAETAFSSHCFGIAKGYQPAGCTGSI